LNRTDYTCTATFYDLAIPRYGEISASIYDKQAAGVCLDLGSLTFDSGDYLDINCGLGPKVTSFPLGHSNEKQYVATSGGAASNCTSAGASARICSDTAGYVLRRAVLVPYRTYDGAWRLKYNIGVSITSGTSLALLVDGITIVTTPTLGMQAASGTNNTADWCRADAEEPRSFTMACGIGSAGFAMSGDIELASKPVWAEGN